MNKQLSDLYQTVILKHNKEPYNFKKAEDLPHHLEAYNPLCGDHFHVYLSMEEGVMTQAFFSWLWLCCIQSVYFSIAAIHRRQNSGRNKTIDCPIQASSTGRGCRIRQRGFDGFCRSQRFSGARAMRYLKLGCFGGICEGRGITTGAKLWLYRIYFSQNSRQLRCFLFRNRSFYLV